MKSKSMKLKTLIVDDEELARNNLEMLINEFCPDLEVVDKADSKETAIEMINTQNPDVVFLDIRMPSGAEGFEILEEVENRNFLVVFVTAFKDYAVKAFNANAVYYILKPIDIDDLKAAAEKLKAAYETFESSPDNYNVYFESLKNLSDKLVKGKSSDKVVISHSKGLKIVEDEDITYLEASGNCTMLYFQDGSRYLDTRTLKVYENLLSSSKFYRVHKSYIINLNQLKEYLNEDGHYAVLKNGKQIPIARNRITSFTQMLKSL